MRQLRYDELTVSVAPSAEAAGAAAAERFAAAVRAELATVDTGDAVAVILATGNSQFGFVRAVRERDDIDWSRLVVLHMDEYAGMTADHSASFRRWFADQLLPYVTPREFHGIRGDHEPVEEELARYSKLLADLDPAVCVMGIGENGHLAFNDPPADFDTTALVHLVDLDDACRRQQVGEGHFPSLAQTPTQALSLTVPALIRPRTVLVVTPEARKAEAVRAALEGPVTPDCPASVLRTVGHAQLFLDEESAGTLRDQVA
ncbi:glucosamine-6-phosphate deaminase [Actinopolymorpha cephalotaxi]|uniref:Glucosamine-6-phosphate deaminase n=1 Tax=Actinopolymorpha cephalotaxi TaxID=504797 RepID=A0A1I2LMM7_9ACTN|nr:6-phosphogluconolactonase [Actinopolymorpha cephalotaxi]NYH81361.1 glucosamine-6-phosphate deaminase [Actinopolymorpha cephalotaxi]SFF80515.1 glucosamine-6-phosphate deaminase [Actinopolymorpha cephalotaxi]